MKFFFFLQEDEKTNDERYLKCHNLFEKKENNYRKKILAKFYIKKPENDDKNKNNENKGIYNDLYNINKENVLINSKKDNSSIIKIFLQE